LVVKPCQVCPRAFKCLPTGLFGVICSSMGNPLTEQIWGSVVGIPENGEGTTFPLPYRLDKGDGLV
ncbi:MAG: hypothetical protein DRI91_05505, partial [Aquificota bacterium]